jgi:hypothetical protein
MMPWNRLRVERPSDIDVLRRSDLEPSQRPYSTYGLPTDIRSAGEPPRRRIRDSVVSLSAVRDQPTFDTAASPPIQDTLPVPKNRRFSMLKFRHASDSQLSKTAKEHAEAAAAPPIPACEYIGGIDHDSQYTDSYRQSPLQQSSQPPQLLTTWKNLNASKLSRYQEGLDLRTKTRGFREIRCRYLRITKISKAGIPNHT